MRLVRYTWGDVEGALMEIAQALQLEPKSLVAIARGGCVPTVLLSHLSGCEHESTLHVRSYSDTQFKKTKPMVHDYINFGPQNVFVDDILDTGDTVLALVKLYPGAKFVMPFAKTSGLMKAGDHLLMTPPIIVNDDDWIVFPWERTLKERKDTYHEKETRKTITD
jgi:hypoxanthine phosphoribosyltransferase